MLSNLILFLILCSNVFIIYLILNKNNNFNKNFSNKKKLIKNPPKAILISPTEQLKKKLFRKELKTSL